MAKTQASKVVHFCMQCGTRIDDKPGLCKKCAGEPEAKAEPKAPVKAEPKVPAASPPGLKEESKASESSAEQPKSADQE